MQNRRDMLVGVCGVTALAGLASPLRAEEGVVKGRRGGPDMIKGSPPRLDFGKGLIIPMDERIFRTLWEGEDRWITYGRAISTYAVRAMGRAEDVAVATMKFMLLTLAFEPDRLVKIEGCGWKLASGDPKDFVTGDIALPGRPVMPTTDQFMGGETSDGEPRVRALTGYMVMKADADLSFVRAHGQRL